METSVCCGKPLYPQLSVTFSFLFLYSLPSYSSLPLSHSVRLSDADGAGGSVWRPCDATQTEEFPLWRLHSESVGKPPLLTSLRLKLNVH